MGLFFVRSFYPASSLDKQSASRADGKVILTSAEREWRSSGLRLNDRLLQSQVFK